MMARKCHYFILLLIKMTICHSSRVHIKDASADVIYKLEHDKIPSYEGGPSEGVPSEIIPQQSNIQAQENINQTVQLSIEEKLLSNTDNQMDSSENNINQTVQMFVEDNLVSDRENETENPHEEIGQARLIYPMTSIFESQDNDLDYHYDIFHDTDLDVYDQIMDTEENYDLESTEAPTEAPSEAPMIIDTTDEPEQIISDSSNDLEIMAKHEEELALIISRVEKSALETVSKENPDNILAYMTANGSFSDLNYKKSNGVKDHVRRVGALVYHFNNDYETDKPSKLFKNGDIMNLFHHINASFYYATYNIPRLTGGNWWHKVIGTPIYMWEAVFLARNVLPKQLIQDFLDVYWVNSSEGPVWNPEAPGEQMTGGNLGPRVLLAEVEGLLRGPNLTYHHEIQDELHNQLILKKGWGGNGIKADGCIHQHNIQGDRNTKRGYVRQTLGHIYNNQYGKELHRHIALVMNWFADTFLEFDESTVEGLYDAYLQCHQWLFRGHVVEPTSTGRFITSGYAVTKNAGEKGVLATAELLLELGHHKEEIQNVLHRYHNVQPYAQYALQGNRHFFSSDIMAHQRREFMASVRLLSNRTARPESWAVEKMNKDGYFQGDGFLSIVIDGKEYGEENSEVFQVYDWAKIPGVTNKYTARIPKFKTSTYRSNHFLNNSTFVGGVSDGSMGLAVMDLARPTLPLRATKSWFFFDNVIVAMGTGITLSPEQEPTDAPVITTLAQEVYRDTGYTIGLESSLSDFTLGFGHHAENGPKWLHHHLTGYVFLHGEEKLQVEVQNRVNNNNDNSSSLPVFMAWLDHGAHPSLGSYAYVILPGALSAATKAFAQHPDIAILTQTQHLHAVCHLPSQTVGIMMAQEGFSTVTISSCGSWGNVELEFNHPVVALITVTNIALDHLTFTITLADPHQIHETMVVTLQWSGRLFQRTVVLPKHPYSGASVNTTFTV